MLVKELAVSVMVLNTTFNNISIISWRSALLVEETGVSGENHRPVAKPLLLFISTLELDIQLSRRRVGITKSVWPCHIFVPVPIQNLDFQWRMSQVCVCVSLSEVRDDCSFCWCLWNCWPSLLKLLFKPIWLHNTSSRLYNI